MSQLNRIIVYWQFERRKMKGLILLLAIIYIVRSEDLLSENHINVISEEEAFKKIASESQHHKHHKSPKARGTILYIPLDERYTTRDAFLNLAEVTLYDIVTPPTDMISRMKVSANLTEMYAFIAEVNINFKFSYNLMQLLLMLIVFNIQFPMSIKFKYLDLKIIISNLYRISPKPISL